MRRLYAALAAIALLCPAAVAQAPAGFTQVIANRIVDASGNPVASGTVTFQVVDGGRIPMSVRVGGGGQTISAPSVGQVNGGAFSVPVVDVSLTAPSFPCIMVTVIDNSTGSTVYQNPCIQPTGGAYNLDNFSANTTPVLPQAGDTVQGDLNVNGNLGITGNLSVGGFSAATFQANYTNGVLNASLFGGSDILAKAQSAFSACSWACTVFIPAGSYTATSAITMANVQTAYSLVMDSGTVINYTGTANAIETPTITGGTNHLVRITGGWIKGTSAGQNGIHVNPINHLVIDHVKISGFTNAGGNTVGNGIYDNGGNSIELEDISSFGNTNGVAITGQTNFSSNAVHILNSDLSENSGWGFISFDSHVNSSANNSCSIINTVIEGNSVGGADIAYSNACTIQNDHFEQAGYNVRLNNGYNGTSNAVLNNYFIPPTSGTTIFVVNGFNTLIKNNYEDPVKVGKPTNGLCFVQASNAGAIDEQNNFVSSVNERCWPGQSAGWNTQFVPSYEMGDIENPTGGPVNFGTGATLNGIFGGGSAPSVTLNTTGVGSGATFSLSAASTATDGQITITTGTSPFHGSVLLATFNTGASFTAPHALLLHLTAGNANAAGVTLFQGAAATTAVQLDTASGLTASTTYVINYLITAY